MFDIIARSIAQHLENASTDEVKKIWEQLNDSETWQTFIRDTMQHVEDTLFHSEFAQDCCAMSSATLCDLENHDVFGSMATAELEARSVRQQERKKLIESLHPDNGEIVGWFVSSDWMPLNNAQTQHISDEEAADVARTNHKIYTWALDGFFEEAFEQKKDYSKISFCSDQLPHIMEYLTKHNENAIMCKISDAVRHYWENMPITTDIGISWYLSMAKAMMPFYEDDMRMRILRKHLVALQSCEFTPASYALCMLRAFAEDDRIRDLVEDVTYDYIVNHPDPSELFIVYLNGWYHENAKKKILSTIRLPILEYLISKVCV